MNLYFCDPYLDPTPYITKPLHIKDYTPSRQDIALFDQNGYDLTELEKRYYKKMYTSIHRNVYHTSLRKVWYLDKPMDVQGALQLIEAKQDPFAPWNNVLFKTTGAVLNHAHIYERKGFKGEALAELQEWATVNPMIYKIIKIKPKWGIDFSMDYCGVHGEVFEIFHYEWDSFIFEETNKMKKMLETIIDKTDWEAAAIDLWARRSEWKDLHFFDQSNWKCNYFGIPNEQFKSVLWDV
jgi:hypothetical protein